MSLGPAPNVHYRSVHVLRGNSGWELLSVEEVLTSLEQMVQQPSVENLICILQKCRRKKNIAYARRVHRQICDKGLEAHRALGNYLVPMFVDCGSVLDAHQVFNSLVNPNEYSWTSLIHGYMERGELQLALDLFQRMQEDCVHPSRYTLVFLMKAYAGLKRLERGREIHTEIAKHGFDRNPFVGSIVVDMYAKCGSLEEAWEVFDKLPVRDVVVWNALITGCAEHRLVEDALNCLNCMQLEGVSPNAVTLVCILKACGSKGAIDSGRYIQATLGRLGLKNDPFIGNTLVDMFAKCGLFAEAWEMFHRLQVQDVVSWTALISGYAEHGLGEEALKYFQQMQLESVSPDSVTFACSLKACGSIRQLNKGREVHAKIFELGLERNLFIGSALVDMYIKCDSLAEALTVFDEFSVRDIVLWNALIAGYAKHELGNEVMNCLEQIQLEGASPDAFALICGLKACGNIGAIDSAQELHAEIVKQGYERDSTYSITVVDMYAKWGLLAEAWELLDRLPAQDVVSWTALIAGYGENGLCEEALNFLDQLQEEGVAVDAVTFICCLKACSSIGAVDRGEGIHAEITKQGYERELIFGISLVDMYGKCGLLAEAQEVFDSLLVQDVVSWSALIAGYARQGESEAVFHLLQRMREEGVQPNGITYLSVLTVCSHAGLVGIGQKYFVAMSKEQGIILTIEHYNCMVDLLGRAGQLDKAVVMLERMPYQPDLVTWSTFLGACQKWGNVVLGRQAFEQVVMLNKNCDVAFIMMSNIYADAHMWEDMEEIEAMRVGSHKWKPPGASSTEYGIVAHAFGVGDTKPL